MAAAAKPALARVGKVTKTVRMVIPQVAELVVRVAYPMVEKAAMAAVPLSIPRRVMMAVKE